MTSTPDPNDLADKIDALRAEIIFDEETEPRVVLDPFGAEHYLLACAALETAHRHMRLAALHTARAVAGG